MDGKLVGPNGRPQFQRITGFTRSAPWHVNIPWTMVEDTLARWNVSAKTGQPGLLQLDPEFQRAHVWDDVKRTRYVEYILRDGKSSRAIYFNQADWGTGYSKPVYLVDGKQRLEAVRKFLANELPIFGGYLYADFSDGLPYSADFHFHMNDLRTDPEILQWYLDLNEGGVAHTEDELAKVRAMLLEARRKADGV
jgi:hypothetical protein